jgi:DNA replication protein DnaC
MKAVFSRPDRPNPRPSVLESGPCPQAHHVRDSHQLVPLEANYSVLFTTLSLFAEDLMAVPYPSVRRQRLRRYLQPRVLVMDEIGYTKLSLDQSQACFELVRDRYEKGSIILTSNTSFAEWGTLLGGDEVLATALLDRLLHHAEVLSISAPATRWLSLYGLA